METVCVGHTNHSLALYTSQKKKKKIFGNSSEFASAINFVAQTVNFDKDLNVSVFETNIRILGGLISAHLLASESPQLLPEYDGKMLDLAIDIADRLMPAFQTKTGIPYGTVKRFLFHSLLHLAL